MIIYRIGGRMHYTWTGRGTWSAGPWTRWREVRVEGERLGWMAV